LCLILDQDILRIDAQHAMQQALDAGVTFFQYRNKNGPRKDIYETALMLARIAGNAQACFILNDHADIAMAVGADGVHLGQDDLPIEFARKLLGKEKIIGISTHSLEQAVVAEAAGADYIGFGPIYQTTTKDAGSTQGILGIATIKQAVTLPIIAIGGINRSNIQDVIRSGADGVAVISAILSAENITMTAENMIRSISNVGRE
jgi:thiamine-phosphate pyrophosphorylase